MEGEEWTAWQLSSQYGWKQAGVGFLGIRNIECFGNKSQRFKIKSQNNYRIYDRLRLRWRVKSCKLVRTPGSQWLSRHVAVIYNPYKSLRISCLIAYKSKTSNVVILLDINSNLKSLYNLLFQIKNRHYQNLLYA